MTDEPTIAPENKDAVLPPETGQEIEPKKSLREEIRENYKRAADKDSGIEPEKPEGKPNKAAPKEIAETGRQRDERGKFAAKPDPVAAAAPIVPAALPAEKPIPAPQAWKAELKAKWEALPADIREEISRREQEAHKKITEVDAERHYGRELKEVITPYMPLLAASQATPAKAVAEMLGYAHILQTRSPQEKGHLLWQLAQRWGADMRFTPQAATQPQNQIGLLQHELAETKKQLAGLPQALQQQQEEREIKRILEAFAADPKHPHYEKVKTRMSALLSVGDAADLEDAYEKACYADSEIRPSLIAEQQKAEAKRIADEKKAKAEAARNAASSVKGSPGLNGAAITQQAKRSLREELRANYRAVTEH